MEVYVAIIITALVLGFVVMGRCLVCLNCEVAQLRKGIPQKDVITQAVNGARESVSRALQQGHEMTQADKDARTAMYKELREQPAEGVDDVSDKMSMMLQGTVRELEVTGVEMRRVKPGPAINAVFSRERAAGMLLRIETDDGFPAGSSEWVERPNGEWVLRITDLPVLPVPRLSQSIS